MVIFLLLVLVFKIFAKTYLLNQVEYVLFMSLVFSQGALDCGSSSVAFGVYASQALGLGVVPDR